MTGQPDPCCLIRIKPANFKMKNRFPSGYPIFRRCHSTILPNAAANSPKKTLRSFIYRSIDRVIIRFFAFVRYCICHSTLHGDSLFSCSKRYCTDFPIEIRKTSDKNELTCRFGWKRLTRPEPRDQTVASASFEYFQYLNWKYGWRATVWFQSCRV